MQTKQIPEAWRIERKPDGIAVFDEKGRKRCGAKRSTDGTACKKSPVKGRYRCEMHNGNAPVGEAANAFVHGKQSRYVRFLPPRLQERYTELIESTEINNLAENVGLLDLRLTELANRLDIGEFGASYNALRSMHNRANREMQTAFNSNDAEERREALQTFIGIFTEMGELILTGQKDYQIWGQILDISAERRQQVKTIADIEHKGENAVPIAQLMGIITRLDELFSRVNRLESAEERAREMSLGIHKIVNFAG